MFFGDTQFFGVLKEARRMWQIVIAAMREWLEEKGYARSLTLRDPWRNTGGSFGSQTNSRRQTP